MLTPAQRRVLQPLLDGGLVSITNNRRSTTVRSGALVVRRDVVEHLVESGFLESVKSYSPHVFVWTISDSGRAAMGEL